VPSPVPKGEGLGRTLIVRALSPGNEELRPRVIRAFSFARMWVQVDRWRLARPSGRRGQLRAEFGFAAGLQNDLELPLLPLGQCGAGNLDRLAICRGV